MLFIHEILAGKLERYLNNVSIENGNNTRMLIRFLQIQSRNMIATATLSIRRYSFASKMVWAQDSIDFHVPFTV